MGTFSVKVLVNDTVVVRTKRLRPLGVSKKVDQPQNPITCGIKSLESGFYLLDPPMALGYLDAQLT